MECLSEVQNVVGDLHSNMVKFKFENIFKFCFTVKHLHSNMVKFKYDIFAIGLLCVSFTFQYG